MANKVELYHQALYALNALVDGDVTTSEITGAADGAAIAAVITARAATATNENRRQSYRRRGLDLAALVAGGDLLPASVVGPATGLASLVTHLRTFNADIAGSFSFSGSYYLQ